MPSAISSPKKRRRGQPAFAPTEEQRSLVKVMAAGGDYTQERMCRLIINPKSKEPIDLKTLRKAFAYELGTGKDDMMAMMSTTLLAQAKKGSLGHLIWFEKTRLGVRDPTFDKPKDDPTGGSGTGGAIKHEVEIIGGLPSGSSPAKPEGDDYSEIPPEESHG